MQIKEFQSEENAGERIDKFLTEKVPELSRSYIQKLIKEKNVKVNSTVIKSNYKVAKGGSNSDYDTGFDGTGYPAGKYTIGYSL